MHVFNIMEIVLEKYSSEIIAKAKSVKALIFDVDGVLTDGGIVYTNSGDELKAFNVKDGQIIQHLKKHNILVGAITGRASKLVERRCTELKLDFFHQGIKDKYSCLVEVMKDYQLEDIDIAYVGDDIIDLKVISNCGLGISPSDALSYVKLHSDLITEAAGGKGVVREVGDLILAAKGLLEGIVENHIK